MVAGDKWLYLPPALGFGDEGSERRDTGRRRRWCTLELVSIEGATTAAAARRGRRDAGGQGGLPGGRTRRSRRGARPLPPPAVRRRAHGLPGGRRAGPSGEASFALSAESRYDFKAGKFIPSAVERMLKLSAVFVRHQGMPWTKCRTERDRGASAAEVQSALEGCVTVARWRHDEL